MSYVLLSRMMPSPSWEMDLDYIESRFSSGQAIDVERLIECAKEAAYENYEEGQARIEELTEQLAESEKDRVRHEKRLGRVRRLLKGWVRVLREAAEQSDAARPLTDLLAEVLEDMDDLDIEIDVDAEYEEVRERAVHEPCRSCKVPSVPAEGIADQMLRDCPECGRVWAEK